MGVRKPFVAGQFYEHEKKLLKQQVEKTFKHKYGPGLPDGDKNHGTVKGAIVPHAGIMFSGMCAAHSFKAIKESGDYDAFVLIGFSHSRLESNHIVTSRLDWETPMGVVESDKEIVDGIIKDQHIDEDDQAMQYEHSIEVQLPFLQYLYDAPKIVPILVGEGCDFKDAAEHIDKVVQGKKVCFIASTDFTHYGPSFGYVPFEEDIQKNLYKLDEGAIEEIKVLNTKGFLNYIQSTGATICGKNSVALLLELLYDKVNRIEWLKYYTSGDLLEDYTNSVSYASVIFEAIKL